MTKKSSPTIIDLLLADPEIFKINESGETEAIEDGGIICRPNALQLQRESTPPSILRIRANNDIIERG